MANITQRATRTQLVATYTALAPTNVENNATGYLGASVTVCTKACKVASTDEKHKTTSIKQVSKLVRHAPTIQTNREALSSDAAVLTIAGKVRL